mmetsp:Transcript_93156/g.263334  ORF Transcript_93156/g.263334 Transcript_93156/m.263334 type:complete len:134 (-) Transcript_93156:95-496(-)
MASIRAAALAALLLALGTAPALAGDAALRGTSRQEARDMELNNEFNTSGWQAFMQASARQLSDVREVQRRDAVEQAVQEDSGYTVAIHSEFADLEESDEAARLKVLDHDRSLDRVLDEDYAQRLRLRSASSHP